MPTAPGLKPFVDEPIRYAGVFADPDLMRALRWLAARLGTSQTKLLLYCATQGMNPLLSDLGLDTWALPHHLEDVDRKIANLTRHLPGAEFAAGEGSEPAKLPISSASSGAKVGFLESQFEVFEPMARKLKVSKATLATWAVVQHLNVVLVACGRGPIAMPEGVASKLPNPLRVAAGLPPREGSQEPLDLSVARARMKESRLVS